MARAARPERGILATLKRLEFFGLRGELGSQLGVVLVVATPPPKKGQKGCGLGEAWWRVRWDRGLSLCQDNAAQTTQGSCKRDRSRIGTKKLDLKSNCGATTA